MNSSYLRVNMNHMKGQINHDFLAAKDHLTKCVIANFAIIHCTTRRLDSIVMEDGAYNQVLKTCLSLPGLKEVLAYLELVEFHYDALDMYTFVEEFVASKYKPNKVCYVLVTIDAGYYLSVTMKDI